MKTLLLVVLFASVVSAQTTAPIVAATDLIPLCMRPVGGSSGAVGVEGNYNQCLGNEYVWSTMLTDGGFYRVFRNHVTGSAGRVLTDIGGSISLQTYAGAANQKWRALFEMCISGNCYWIWQNGATGKCLDAPSAWPGYTTTLVPSTCPNPPNGTNNSQLFVSTLFQLNCGSTYPCVP